MEKFEKLSQYIRSTIILSMICMLPVLGSCQARKAFLTFFSGDANTEQSDLTILKPVTAAVSCNADTDLKRHYMAPEQSYTFTHAAALLAADYFLYNLPALSAKRIWVKDQFRANDLYTLPLFLRNRSILI